jgi:D-arabinose 1-dehydrogenase-like Zn-dependent alcohol dehydrogenase
MPGLENSKALEDINGIFSRMHNGDIQGRIVINFQK